MIYDADTHYCPRYLFDNLKDKHPNFVEFYNETCKGEDLDKVWRESYNQIKDPSWPECNVRSDFNKLPDWIRAELKTHLSGSRIKINDDLTKLYVEDFRNQFPTLEDHLYYLDILKTDYQLLAMYAPFKLMYYQTEKNLALDITRTWNDKIYDLATNNDKFGAVAWLPLQDLQSSIKELEHVINKNFFTAQLNDNPYWSFMPDLWIIFEIFEKNRFPVYLHPTKYNPYPLPWTWIQNKNYELFRNRWNTPDEFWLTNIAGMISEGMLDKYPNLRIILAEHGVDWISEMRDIMISNGLPDPLPYFKNNFWFTIEPEKPNFLRDAELIGWDRLLFATDYPHNDLGGLNKFNDVDAINLLLSQNKITKKDYDLLTHENFLWLKNNR